MRKILAILVFHLISIAAHAQSSYSTVMGKPVGKLRSIDLTAHPSSEGFVQYLEYPKAGGNAYHEFLGLQKHKASQLFPKRELEQPAVRAVIEPPVLLDDFQGNSNTGIPLDNHLAVNHDGQIAAVVNTQLLVLRPNGTWEKSFSLDDFWSDLGESEFYFDPRIIYDPVEERFIMAMMQDGNCAGSNIVFAFSASSDPTGLWHLYRFDGCPNADDTFADFPMISITRDELFFTYNAVYQDSSWQTGFSETLIYQINKFDGYAGADLRWRSWSDINHNSRKLRYIYPVKYALEDMPSESYFLSNRSFDIQNDTVFLLHINGNIEHPDLELNIDALRSDMPYGVPPNAEQPTDFLQTNDARILDGFYLDGEIQFVSSTMDPATGRSAVYHGIITGVPTNPLLSAQLLRNASDHFAYPAIAWTGTVPGERDAIIVASHASPVRFPGYSALYFNEGYSEWIPVKEGTRSIDMLKVNNPFGLDPTLERWGDYSGLQRHYAEEGTVYSTSSFGRPGNVNDTWIGYLRRPGKASAVDNTTAIDEEVTVFPNPVSTEFTFETNINTTAIGKRLEVKLFSIAGHELRTVFDRKITQPGSFRFHYTSHALTPGMYILFATLDGLPWHSEKLVVN